MNTVPVWLYLIIFFFLYDDLWFSAEEYPVIHYLMVAILLIVSMLFAIGQGRIIKEAIRIITDKLKDRFAFLR